MWGDVQPGRGFRGILNYVFHGYKKDPKRPEDVRLIGGNMIGRNPRELAKEFAYSRALRPDIKVAMSHIPLSLADGEYFDDHTWNDVAEQHLDYLGYTDVQWTMIRHSDTEHDHVHIIASSIRWDGTKVDSSMNWEKGAKSRKLIEKAYGLVRSAMTPTEARKARRRQPPHPKKEGATPDEEATTKRHLRQILKETVKTSPTIADLIEQLEAQGVRLRPNIAKTGRVSGMSYALDGHTFKGSKLGKAYAWQGLQRLSRIEYDPARDLEPLKQASLRGLPTPETSPAAPAERPEQSQEPETSTLPDQQEQPEPPNREKGSGNNGHASQLPEATPNPPETGRESSTKPGWEGEPQGHAESDDSVSRAHDQDLDDPKPAEPINRAADPADPVPDPHQEQALDKAQLCKILDEAAKDEPRFPVFMARLKALDIGLEISVSPTDASLTSIRYKFKNQDFQGDELGPAYELDGLLFFHSIKYDFQMDIEEIMRIRGREIPVYARRVKEETGLYPIPGQPHPAASNEPQEQSEPATYIPRMPRSPEEQERRDRERLFQLIEEAVIDKPRFPVMIERLKARGVELGYLLSSEDGSLQAVHYDVKARRYQGEEIAPYFEASALLKLHNVKFDYQTDVEELMRIRGRNIPQWVRRVKEETGAYPLPGARPEPPPKQTKQTSKPEQDTPSPTPGKWETLKKRLAATFKGIWGKLSTILEKAKNKLKKEEDTRKEQERHTENTQTESTPEPKPQQPSPELETWNLHDSTGTIDPNNPLLGQEFYGKCPESADLERTPFGSMLSKLNNINTAPRPWDEDDEEEERNKDKDKPRPKYRGPSR